MCHRRCPCSALLNACHVPLTLPLLCTTECLPCATDAACCTLPVPADCPEHLKLLCKLADAQMELEAAELQARIKEQLLLLSEGLLQVHGQGALRGALCVGPVTSLQRGPATRACYEGLR